MSSHSNDRPMYLVAELRVRDPELLTRYAQEVQPLMAQYGGRIIAISLPKARVLEGDWEPPLLVLHRWESEERFDEFWRSAEYQPIKRLRHESCDSRVVVFDGLPLTEAAPAPAVPR